MPLPGDESRAPTPTTSAVTVTVTPTMTPPPTLNLGATTVTLPTDEDGARALVVLVVVAACLFVAVLNRRRSTRSLVSDNALALLVGIGLGGLVGDYRKYAHSEPIVMTVFFDAGLPLITFSAALNEGEKATRMGVVFALTSTVFSAVMVGRLMATHFGTPATFGSASDAESTLTTTTDQHNLTCVAPGCMLAGTVLAPVSSRLAVRGANALEEDPPTDLESEDPPKFAVESLLTCESLLSGAFAIILFSCVQEARAANADLAGVDVLRRFVVVGMGSAVLGALVGALCSSSLSGGVRPDSPAALALAEFLTPTREVSLVAFWTFFSYALARVVGLSPAGTLFFTGIVMSHTTLHCLSDQAATVVRVGSETLASIAESIVLMYLGLAASSFAAVLDTSLGVHAMLVVGVACFVARFFVAAGVVVLGQAAPSLNLGHASYVGSCVFLAGIRGAVSFSLALGMGKGHKEVISVAGALVVVSNVVLSPALSLVMVARDTRVKRRAQQEQDDAPVFGGARVVRGESSAALEAGGGGGSHSYATFVRHS